MAEPRRSISLDGEALRQHVQGAEPPPGNQQPSQQLLDQNSFNRQRLASLSGMPLRRRMTSDSCFPSSPAALSPATLPTPNGSKGEAPWKLAGEAAHASLLPIAQHHYERPVLGQNHSAPGEQARLPPVMEQEPAAAAPSLPLLHHACAREQLDPGDPTAAPDAVAADRSLARARQLESLTRLREQAVARGGGVVQHAKLEYAAQGPATHPAAGHSMAAQGLSPWPRLPPIGNGNAAFSTPPAYRVSDGGFPSSLLAGGRQRRSEQFPAPSPAACSVGPSPQHGPPACPGEAQRPNATGNAGAVPHKPRILMLAEQRLRQEEAQQRQGMGYHGSDTSEHGQSGCGSGRRLNVGREYDPVALKEEEVSWREALAKKMWLVDRLLTDLE